MAALYLISVFVIATCGLVYELLTGTLASYLLGDSVTQFSTVIGVYLFSMGIGSFLSKYIEKRAIQVFIQVELLIALVGGFSSAVLFTLFDHVASFRFLLYFVVVVIGTLVGLEIPLLMRILKDRFEFKELVAKVFTFDYVGALIASLLFPLVLVPHLGLMRSAFLFGIFNAAVALVTLIWLRRSVSWPRLMMGQAVLILLSLVTGFVFSERILSRTEALLYPSPIVFAKSTPYQRLVVTRSQDDVRLYLNGNLQFSSRDEYRYHEALVHVGMLGMTPAKQVLVLGGGDGLAIREILKHAAVESVTLVDLDPAMTDLFSTHSILTRLNHGALTDPRVTVVNADAFAWLENNLQKFDFIVVDFPDPANFSLGKLYSTRFYNRLARALAPDGTFVVQSTSPLIARKSFWCVDRTIQESGFVTAPYHAYVPSFGEWGFIIGHHGDWNRPQDVPLPLRFLDQKMLSSLFDFPPDMARIDTEVNRLNNQVLVRYFEEEWARYAVDFE